MVLQNEPHGNAGLCVACENLHTSVYLAQGEFVQLFMGEAELEFIFRDTAFRHNLSEADIRHAFETCCHVGLYQDRTNVYLLLGFDKNANPVEILYNEFGDNCVNVFHAMHCQKKFFYLFNQEEMP